MQPTRFNNLNLNTIFRTETQVSSSSTGRANWMGREVQPSPSATALRIEKFGLTFAFTSWMSENSDCILAEQDMKATERFLLPSINPSDLRQSFIQICMKEVGTPWVGYIEASEENVKERLNALLEVDVMQDSEFRKDWSFFALTEIPGSTPDSQFKCQWLKNGEIHSCIFDTASMPPQIVVIAKDDTQTHQSSISNAIMNIVGGKYMQLSVLEASIEAFNKERGVPSPAPKQVESDDETEGVDDDFGPDVFIPQRLRDELGIEKGTSRASPQASSDTDDDESIDGREQDGEGDEERIHFPNNHQRVRRSSHMAFDDVDEDGDAAAVNDKTDEARDDDAAASDKTAESSKKNNEKAEVAEKEKDNAEVQAPIVFTPSFMQLRLTEADRRAGRVEGKRVYFNPSPRYLNPRLKKYAPMRRYFPPAHRLPNNCK